MSRPLRLSVFLLFLATLNGVEPFLPQAAAQPEPLPQISRVEYPSRVYPGQQFRINVTVDYDFRIWILADLGIFDPSAVFMHDSLRLILWEPTRKTYTFWITAPTIDQRWLLRAWTRCFCSNTWIEHPQKGRFEFTVEVSNQAKLTLGSNIPNVVITVQDSKIDLSKGPVQVQLTRGIYRLEAPRIVQVNERERFVFVSWSDGVMSNPRIMFADGEVRLDAKFKHQFFVSVKSEKGEARGTGWYDEGSATKVFSPQTGFDDPILAFFGLKRKFVGWRGTQSSNEVDQRFAVNGPEDLVAEYEIDWQGGVPAFVLLGFATASLVFAACRVLRPKKRHIDDKLTSEERRSVWGPKLRMMVLILPLIASTVAGLHYLPAVNSATVPLYRAPPVISVANATWFYWNFADSDTCIIWLSGGLVFPDHEKINPYELESFNTMRYIQDLTRHYCVVALQKGSDKLTQPEANRTLNTHSYYSGSVFIAHLHDWLRDQGYAFTYLAGFSIGGTIAIHETVKRDPTRWSTPNGVILISTLVSQSQTLSAQDLRANLLMLYGEVGFHLFPESGESFFRRTPEEGWRGRSWFHKEFHLLKNAEHEVWTRPDNGEYDPRPFVMTVSFIERAKTLQFFQIQSAVVSTAIGSAGRLPLCDEAGLLRLQLKAPHRVLVNSTANLLVRIDGPFASRIKLVSTLVDLDRSQLLSVTVKESLEHRPEAEMVIPAVSLAGISNFTIVVISANSPTACLIAKSAVFSVFAGEPLLTVRAAIPNLPIMVDGKVQTLGEDGLLSVELKRGLHRLEAPALHEVADGVKAIFAFWGDGEQRPVRTVKLTENTELRAYYNLQFRLSVSSNGPPAEGGGWYYANSSAFVRVTDLHDPNQNLIFSFWNPDGDLSPSKLVLVDAPKGVMAQWVEIPSGNAVWPVMYVIALQFLIAGLLLIGRRHGGARST